MALDHVASRIVNADQGIMGSDVEFRVFDSHLSHQSVPSYSLLCAHRQNG
jgi:hypothetical protein